MPRRSTLSSRWNAEAGARAERAVNELRETQAKYLELGERRIQLAYEASEAGMTNEEIAAAIGTGQSTVGNWIRTARARNAEPVD